METQLLAVCYVLCRSTSSFVKRGGEGEEKKNVLSKRNLREGMFHGNQYENKGGVGQTGC